MDGEPDPYLKPPRRFKRRFPPEMIIPNFRPAGKPESEYKEDGQTIKVYPAGLANGYQVMKRFPGRGRSSD